MRFLAHPYSSKRIFRWVFAVLFLLVLSAVIAWVVSRIFVLRQIEVVGDAVEIQVDKERLGKNILFLQTRALEQQLLSTYPLLASVKFTKTLPSTLVVHVTLRSPFALLTTQTQSYVVDRDAVVLDNQKEAILLPNLRFDIGSLSIGTHVTDQRVTQSIQFLRALHDISIDQMQQMDSAGLQAKSGQTNIFLPQFGDITRKAATLQTIVTGFRIKGALPAVIDLRFDKPIITY